MKHFLFAAAALAVASPALAQDRPTLQPTRDVAVTYRISGTAAAEAPPGPIRMMFSQGGNLMRVEPPGGQVVVIVDRTAQRAFMVMEAQRMVMQMPGAQDYLTRFGQPGANARFTRQGSDTVAGQSCTNWRMEDQDVTATACITGDGVMLRTTGQRQAAPGQPARDGGLEATQVSYGPQDPGLFQVPPGYQTMQMPAGTGLPPRPPR